MNWNLSLTRSMLALLPLLLPMACGSRHSSRDLLQTMGSDSMLVVAMAWAEAYQEVAPEVGVAVNGGGSGVGIAGLLNGTVDIANVSRSLTSAEREMARDQGFAPAVQVVGYDAPTFVVHEDNPVRSLSFRQLAEIYGEGGSIARWEQLDVDVPGCAGGEIVPVSRLDSSGTYQHLRQRILGPTREYRLESMAMQGSKDLVQMVARTPCAIGYTGMAYAPPADVRMVCLAEREGEQCVVPSMQSAVEGIYPLARPLMLISRSDAKPNVEAYVDWVLSDEGQCILRRIGYAPVRPVVCS